MASRTAPGSPVDTVHLSPKVEVRGGEAGEVPGRPVQDVAFCPLCRAWTVEACETIQDMRGCRSLDDADPDPVALMPA